VITPVSTPLVPGRTRFGRAHVIELEQVPVLADALVPTAPPQYRCSIYAYRLGLV
jgi:hypothetical protein